MSISISRRSALMTGALLATMPFEHVLAQIPKSQRAAWSVVRLGSWDDMPAQSIFINPYDMSLTKADDVRATGELSLGAVGVGTASDVSYGVRIRTYPNTRHVFSGSAEALWRRRAIDADGELLDVHLTVDNVVTEAWDATQAGARAHQIVIYSHHGEGQFLNASSEWSVEWNMTAPESFDIRIRLTRQDGTPALGTFALAFRDIDIHAATGNDDHSESVQPISGFDPKIYVLRDSWLLIDTTTGRVRENSQGPNYSADPRETVVFTTGADFKFKWIGHCCGTQLFDSMKSAVNVRVHKSWVGGSALRPKSVTVRLKASNGAVREVALSEDNGWEHTWYDLPLLDRDPIRYSVEEVSVPGFSTKVSGNVASGFNIENTYVVPRMDMPVEKRWSGALADAYRPDSVSVTLTASTGKTYTAVLDAGSAWRHVFHDVPERDGEGRPISYTLDEAPVSFFDTSIEGDAVSGFVVTNTCTVGRADLDKDPRDRTWL